MVGTADSEYETLDGGEKLKGDEWEEVKIIILGRAIKISTSRRLVFTKGGSGACAR